MTDTVLGETDKQFTQKMVTPGLLHMHAKFVSGTPIPLFMSPITVATILDLESL